MDLAKAEEEAEEEEDEQEVEEGGRRAVEDEWEKEEEEVDDVSVHLSGTSSALKQAPYRVERAERPPGGEVTDRNYLPP